MELYLGQTSEVYVVSRLEIVGQSETNIQSERIKVGFGLQ
jgi:hypothetical protein